MPAACCRRGRAKVANEAKLTHPYHCASCSIPDGTRTPDDRANPSSSLRVYVILGPPSRLGGTYVACCCCCGSTLSDAVCVTVASPWRTTASLPGLCCCCCCCECGAGDGLGLRWDRGEAGGAALGGGVDAGIAAAAAAPEADDDGGGAKPGGGAASPPAARPGGGPAMSVFMMGNPAVDAM